MDRKMKLWIRILFVPVLLIILVIAYWIYSNFFSKHLPKMNELCIILLLNTIIFLIYQIKDYSKMGNQKK